MSEPFLDGITVIEVSRGRAAAFCCRLLTDWGAEVIRVEPPGGDPMRTQDAALFERLNGGKKSVTLNTADEAGLALLCRVASYVEVVIEDGIGGLGYDSLSAESGRLVVTSIHPPQEIDSTQGWEQIAGLNAFDATLAALVGVTMTERGQHVVIAADECLATVARLASGGAQPSMVSRSTVSLFRAPVLSSAGGVAQPGEHNDEVYGEMLGLSQEELSTLRARGVV